MSLHLVNSSQVGLGIPGVKFPQPCKTKEGSLLLPRSSLPGFVIIATDLLGLLFLI